MLDYAAIFTRGGALLWTLQFTALRHSPVEALNALIKSCLLEERSGENTFTFVPKLGAHEALKWTFHNGLGLVFVVVYQKALSLLYVDELLAMVKTEFTKTYKPSVMSYPGFTDVFQRMCKDCEARAERLKAGGANGATAPKQVSAAKQPTAKGATGGQAGNGAAAGGVQGASEDDEEEDDDDEDGLGALDASKAAGAAGGGGGRPTDDGSGVDEDAGAAFDLSKLAKGKPPRGAKGSSSGAPPPKKKSSSKDPKPKQARKWGDKGGGSDNAKLDFSADHSEYTAGSESDRQGGYSDVDGSLGGRSSLPAVGVSGMDKAEPEEDVVGNLVREAEALGSKAGKGDASKATGLLGSFMSKLAMRVVGKGALSGEDLAPALVDMKRKLMERNVAEGIAQHICDSVGKSLEGQKLASFTGVGTFVARAFEEALAGILHKRTVDMLLDIRKAQERGRPYVVVFCGVNGVGKSTNLAKIAYWLGQHGIKVLIAACDTFRAGAVEQLKTHCARLAVPLYERGYEKDPAKVASEAIKQAEREGRHVVLVDTAGRMQDNEPLMRALSNLININSPNLVLFVGEALVGNDAVDQLVKFNRALHDLAPPTATTRHAIDGIVLTKFDTIDDKVGAAVSMVYASGAPIMFLGCGQTYADLKRLNVKAVVNALLK